MKIHTKIYLSYFPEPTCEVCGAVAVDIHHIWSRGGGGKDRIENLMGLCRKHHTDYGDKKQWKTWLMRRHMLNLNYHNISYDVNYCEKFCYKFADYANTSTK